MSGSDGLPAAGHDSAAHEFPAALSYSGPTDYHLSVTRSLTPTVNETDVGPAN